MVPGWVIDRIVDIIFFIGIPSLLIASALGPFIFVKRFLRRNFTVLNVLCSLTVAIGLLALVFYLLYWALAILQGIAACQLYSDYTVIQCLLPSQKVIGN